MHTTLIAARWEAAYFATEVYRFRSESNESDSSISDQWARLNAAAVVMHSFLTNPKSWKDREERWSALEQAWQGMWVLDGEISSLFATFRAAWIAAHAARNVTYVD